MTVVGSDWQVLVGDFTGDGRADLLEHQLSTGLVWVNRNNGPGINTFARPSSQSSFRVMLGPNWHLRVGDFDGDGRADLAEHQQSTMHMNIHRNLGVLPNVTAPIFSGVTWRKAYPNAGLNWYPLVGDFTGDGCADYANLYTPTGQFYVVEHQSCTTFPAAPPTWGIGTVTVGVDWRILGQWQ